MLWASVLVARGFQIVMVAVQIDPIFIKIISFMERWVTLATFASFFLNVLVRAIMATKRREQ